MEAFKLKQSIINLLSDASNDKFIVISPNKRKADAENIINCPQVTVYYSNGNFPKNKSSINGPYYHECSFSIQVISASAAKMNLAILNDPSATSALKSQALAEAGNASVSVDEKTESILSLLFNILMQPENRKLGTDYITDRWIDRFEKSNPEQLGSIVLQSASLTLTASCTEYITEEEGIPGDSVDTIIDLGDESKQGVLT